MKRPCAFVLVWCALVALWLGLVIGLVVVAVHFVRKFW
jgi:hypothetical protein